MNGKSLRMARLIRPDTNKTCIVPLDHGITYGPIQGINDWVSTVGQIVNGGADAIIIHKGLLNRIGQYKELAKGRYILHLSASTNSSSDSSFKALICTIEEALKLGADGVSIQVNLGTAYETEMIKDMAMVSRECMNYGMPLLAMMYTHDNPQCAARIAHAARIAEELGADIVKINYPGSNDMASIINCVKIPVVIAGGPKMSNMYELLTIVDNVIKAGASGCAIGRNIFQNEDVGFITRILSRLIHGDLKLQEYKKELQIRKGATA